MKTPRSSPVERLGRNAWRGAGSAAWVPGWTQAVSLHVLELPRFLAVFIALRALSHSADVEVQQDRAEDEEDDFFPKNSRQEGKEK